MILLRPSVQLPARDLRNGALIPIFSALARERRPNLARNRLFQACHALDMTASGGVLAAFWSMIRKSGNRFSGKIMLKQRDEIRIRFLLIGY
jgi:hypothetical protein